MNMVGAVIKFFQVLHYVFLRYLIAGYSGIIMDGHIVLTWPTDIIIFGRIFWIP